MKRILLFAVLLMVQLGFGQKTWDGGAGTSNWGDANNWSPNGVPAITDAVTLSNNAAVIVNIPNAVCASLQLGGAANNTRGILNFATIGSPVLTVGGSITMGGNNNNPNRAGTITFVSGSTLICNSLTLGNNNNSPSILRMSANSTLQTGSLVAAGTGTTWDPSTGTVNMTTTNTLPSTIFTSFNNLNINSGTTTMGRGLTINGNLSVASGANFTSTSNFTLAVTGTTSVTGTLTLGGTAAKTFTGNATINSGGIWNETGTGVINYAGNLQNDGSYTANTSVHTFTGTTKTISGANAISIPNLTINGTTTNNGTLTVSTALSGTGSLTNAVTGTLNIGGTSGITTLTATAVGNVVNYNGVAQTVKATTYNNLTLSGSGAKTTTGITVNGILSMESTATASEVPTYGTAATLQYNTGSNRTAGLEWPATFSGTGGVVIKNSGIVTLNETKTINPGPFSIETGAKVDLGTFAHTAKSLILGGTTAASGSWGGNTSPAININTAYFSQNTGIVNISALTCAFNLITNGDFANAATGFDLAVGWTYRPGYYVETYPEDTYFTTGNTKGWTAELDAGASLRQTVSVVPNTQYIVSFIFARRPGIEAPSPSGVTVDVIEGSTVVSSKVFSTSSLTPEVGTFTFTPTSASITLDFYNHLATSQTYGTIIDNIVLVPSSQVTPLATTSPKGVFNTLASCAGSPVQLDVENVPSSGVTYSWTGSAGATFSATNIRNPIVTFTGTGLKEATVSVTTSGGCISSSTTYVNLNNTNAPTITTVATPAVVASVCQSTISQSTSMAYTATTNSPTSYRIDWNTLADQGTTTFTFVAGGGSLTGIAVPAGTPAGTYAGTLIVTNANCSATRAITMTVNPRPSAPTVGAITDVTCSSTTGSVVLSGLPSSGSWTITATPATSGLTGWTGTNVDNTIIGGLTANTSYTFIVSNGTCSSVASAAAVVNAIPTTATWNGTAWAGTASSTTPPLITQPIVFTGNYSSSGDINGCSCTVSSGNVVINSGHTMTITNAVNVTNNATTSLVFENNASLVQTTNATNTGAIEYRRISSPMKNFDYTYWSSPVWGDGTIVPKQTAKNLSPNTLADKYFRFDPSTVEGWVFYDGEMTPGVGFIIRVPKPGSPAPDNWSGPTYPQPVAFKGIPNNGNYTFTAGASELNLIGNPYPSAIDADTFINANSGIINGALFFWTHNTAITNNEYTADDYASYTLTGSTGTGTGGNFPPEVWVDANNNLVVESGEYVDLNGNGVLDKGLEWIDSNNDNILDVGEWTDSNNNGKVDLAPVEVISNRPLGKIAAGQSFFVENVAAGDYKFTNAMRVVGNNSQFFKQANTKKTATVEKNRVWLNLTNSGGAFKQLLVGYITGATNDWDNMYDGPTFDGQEFVDFYSINQGKNLTIQGRALPFANTDIVPLGYRSTIAGAFDISIDNRDGALAGQEIWLEDKKTNTLHELTKGKYTFTAINGVENDRFVLKYTNKTLGTDENEVADKSLIVSVKNKKITLTSSAEAITQVQLFDLLGRKVYDKSKINAQEWSISNLPSSEQTLIVKTTLANGAVSNKKIIY